MEQKSRLIFHFKFDSMTCTNNRLKFLYFYTSSSWVNNHLFNHGPIYDALGTMNYDLQSYLQYIPSQILTPPPGSHDSIWALDNQLTFTTGCSILQSHVCNLLWGLGWLFFVVFLPSSSKKTAKKALWEAGFA